MKADVHGRLGLALHRARALEANPSQIVRPEIDRLGQICPCPSDTVAEADLLQLAVEHRAVEETHEVIPASRLAKRLSKAKRNCR